MTIPEMEILKTQCVMTVINGEIVFERAAGQAAIESDLSLVPLRDGWMDDDK